MEVDCYEQFYPSEVARLVLGYLNDRKCPYSSEIFLVECSDLQEHYSHYIQGKIHSTKVRGKSLEDILIEYCKTKYGITSEQNNPDHTNLIVCNEESAEKVVENIYSNGINSTSSTTHSNVGNENTQLYDSTKSNSKNDANSFTTKFHNTGDNAKNKSSAFNSDSLNKPVLEQQCSRRKSLTKKKKCSPKLTQTNTVSFRDIEVQTDPETTNSSHLATISNNCIREEKNTQTDVLSLQDTRVQTEFDFTNDRHIVSSLNDADVQTEFEVNNPCSDCQVLSTPLKTVSENFILPIKKRKGFIPKRLLTHSFICDKVKKELKKEVKKKILQDMVILEEILSHQPVVKNICDNINMAILEETEMTSLDSCLPLEENECNKIIKSALEKTEKDPFLHSGLSFYYSKKGFFMKNVKQVSTSANTDDVMDMSTESGVTESHLNPEKLSVPVTHSNVINANQEKQTNIEVHSTEKSKQIWQKFDKFVNSDFTEDDQMTGEIVQENNNGECPKSQHSRADISNEIEGFDNKDKATTVNVLLPDNPVPTVLTHQPTSSNNLSLDSTQMEIVSTENTGSLLPDPNPPGPDFVMPLQNNVIVSAENTADATNHCNIENTKTVAIGTPFVSNMIPAVVEVPQISTLPTVMKTEQNNVPVSNVNNCTDEVPVSNPNNNLNNVLVGNTSNNINNIVFPTFPNNNFPLLNLPPQFPYSGLSTIFVPSSSSNAFPIQNSIQYSLIINPNINWNPSNGVEIHTQMEIQEESLQNQPIAPKEKCPPMQNNAIVSSENAADATNHCNNENTKTVAIGTPFVSNMIPAIIEEDTSSAKQSEMSCTMPVVEPAVEVNVKKKASTVKSTKRKIKIKSPTKNLYSVLKKRLHKSSLQATNDKQCNISELSTLPSETDVNGGFLTSPLKSLLSSATLLAGIEANCAKPLDFGGDVEQIENHLEGQNFKLDHSSDNNPKPTTTIKKPKTKKAKQNSANTAENDPTNANSVSVDLQSSLKINMAFEVLDAMDKAISKKPSKISKCNKNRDSNIKLSLDIFNEEKEDISEMNNTLSDTYTVKKLEIYEEPPKINNESSSDNENSKCHSKTQESVLQVKNLSDSEDENLDNICAFLKMEESENSLLTSSSDFVKSSNQSKEKMKVNKEMKVKPSKKSNSGFNKAKSSTKNKIIHPEDRQLNSSSNPDVKTSKQSKEKIKVNKDVKGKPSNKSSNGFNNTKSSMKNKIIRHENSQLNSSSNSDIKSSNQSKEKIKVNKDMNGKPSNKSSSGFNKTKGSSKNKVVKSKNAKTKSKIGDIRNEYKKSKYYKKLYKELAIPTDIIENASKFEEFGSDINASEEKLNDKGKRNKEAPVRKYSLRMQSNKINYKDDSLKDSEIDEALKQCDMEDFNAAKTLELILEKEAFGKELNEIEDPIVNNVTEQASQNTPEISSSQELFIDESEPSPEIEDYYASDTESPPKVISPQLVDGNGNKMFLKELKVAIEKLDPDVIAKAVCLKHTEKVDSESLESSSNKNFNTKTVSNSTKDGIGHFNTSAKLSKKLLPKNKVLRSSLKTYSKGLNEKKTSKVLFDNDVTKTVKSLSNDHHESDTVTNSEHDITVTLDKIIDNLHKKIELKVPDEKESNSDKLMINTSKRKQSNENIIKHETKEKCVETLRSDSLDALNKMITSLNLSKVHAHSKDINMINTTISSDELLKENLTQQIGKENTESAISNIETNASFVNGQKSVPIVSLEENGSGTISTLPKNQKLSEVPTDKIKNALDKPTTSHDQDPNVSSHTPSSKPSLTSPLKSILKKDHGKHFRIPSTVKSYEEWKAENTSLLQARKSRPTSKVVGFLTPQKKADTMRGSSAKVPNRHLKNLGKSKGGVSPRVHSPKLDSKLLNLKKYSSKVVSESKLRKSTKRQFVEDDAEEVKDLPSKQVKTKSDCSTKDRTEASSSKDSLPPQNDRPAKKLSSAKSEKETSRTENPNIAPQKCDEYIQEKNDSITNEASTLEKMLFSDDDIKILYCKENNSPEKNLSSLKYNHEPSTSKENDSFNSDVSIIEENAAATSNHTRTKNKNTETPKRKRVRLDNSEELLSALSVEMVKSIKGVTPEVLLGQMKEFGLENILNLLKEKD